MKYGFVGLLCMMLAGVALAAGPRAVSERMQASMLVTGSITVAPDGSVKSYVVDHPEQLPAEIVNLIERNVPLWRFIPVVRNGRPVIAEAAMSLRVLATPMGDGTSTVSVSGTNFGRPSSAGSTAGEDISYKQRPAPSYPMAALKTRASGTVYLLLAVNRQGLVEQADAEQVNLDRSGGDHEMTRSRHMLAKAALSAARTWTFNVPTSGEEAAPTNWLVRVPITFSFTPERTRAYGKWHVYVPGPRVIPAWVGKLDVGDSADVVGADSISAVGEGLQLQPDKPLEGA